MGRYRRSTYLTKKKSAKNRENNNSAVTDNTSIDNFYTTESKDTNTRYDYTNKYKTYKDYFTSDIYDSRIFETFSPKRKGSGESYTYDDYTTSGISYNGLRKRPKDRIFSVSARDQVYKSPNTYNNISSFRDYEHSYPKESREKKRQRLMKDFDKTYYGDDVLDESELYVDRNRKYRSPRSRYYQDLIHEEPEKEFEFEKYFEKASPKVGSSPKQRKLDRYDDEGYEKKKKFRSQTPNKEKDYQVYAYQDSKGHEEVFKGKNHPGDLSLSSEVEIKTHEYPVLAFRDPKSGNKESDMVYLPIFVLDKKSEKSRPDKRTEETIYKSNKDNFQIYAANLQEQQNIFQNFGNFPDIVTSKEPTNINKEYAQQQNFGIEATSGMRYAASLLGTILDDTDFRNEDIPNETNAGQRIPFATGKSPFTYQVDVDITPNEPTGSLKDAEKKSSLIKNSSVNDPLHDGYPVTKDYIKVSVSEQNRKNTLAPFGSKEENYQSSALGQRISGEKKSNTVKDEAQTPSNIKLIDDQTITMSIAQSKTSLPKKSIMKNLSQEQPDLKEFSSARQSFAMGTKQNSRASRAEPAEMRDRPTATKLSALNEETSQDLIGKSRTTLTPQQHSADRRSKVSGNETRQGSDRKSMKPDTHSEQTTDRRSKVQSAPWMSSSPVSDHRKSVLHSQAGQDRKSTVAHMIDTPSSQNVRASHAPSRKSAATARPSTANVFRNDERQSMKVSAAERSQRTVPESQGKKSVVQSSPHRNTQNVAGNTGRFSQKLVKNDDSDEALRQFTKDIFQVDLADKGKTPSHRSEQEKPSIQKETRIASAVGPNHDAESKHQSRKSTVGQQSLNAPRQSQNVPANGEPSQEQIGDFNSAGIGKAPTVQEGTKKSSLLRTTSKLFTALSKIGKNKSTDEDKAYITTGSPTGSKKTQGNEEEPAIPIPDNDDTQFVRSIEPTVTQYKKDQHKTLTKSNSKADTKAPKEKKSLSRLFSRSKSRLGDESGDNSKKKKKNKSKSMLGILKRSKSSELSVAPRAEDEGPAGEVKRAECECFAHYVHNTRMCAYFFLGTTLHEQMMNIIKIFLGGS